MIVLPGRRAVCLLASERSTDRHVFVSCWPIYAGERLEAIATNALDQRRANFRREKEIIACARFPFARLSLGEIYNWSLSHVIKYVMQILIHLCTRMYIYCSECCEEWQRNPLSLVSTTRIFGKNVGIRIFPSLKCRDFFFYNFRFTRD